MADQTTQLPVQLVFEGVPFDAGAVLHTLRHLAMRVGWRLVRDSPHRLVYATRATQEQRATTPSTAVVVLSDPSVKSHLARETKPIPLSPGDLLPFPQHLSTPRPGCVAADVIAGAHACMNLWYEQRTRPAADDGWILYDQDWMARAGLTDPKPMADLWLDEIYAAALQIGWPATRPRRHCAVLLSHDVDYLPGRLDLGLPRLARAIVRHLVHRRRPEDAIRVIGNYAAALARRRRPYDEIGFIIAEECRRDATSSFQFVVAREHAADPTYASGGLNASIPNEWEACLHGSYGASRARGVVAAEKKRLETLVEREVIGYRQHYLNFEPSGLFREVADAGLRYDMSIGYNDRCGPRAGTYFPYKPYDLDAAKPYGPWEVPFVLMDTTLATSYRLSQGEATVQARKVLEPVVAAGGCVSIIWHQEQCGGLLDPGYDQVYLAIMDSLIADGAALSAGMTLLPDWEEAWAATMPEPLELPAA